jgi:hypothetical protein
MTKFLALASASGLAWYAGFCTGNTFAMSLAVALMSATLVVALAILYVLR